MKLGQGAVPPPDIGEGVATPPPTHLSLSSPAEPWPLASGLASTPAQPLPAGSTQHMEAREAGKAGIPEAQLLGERGGGPLALPLLTCLSAHLPAPGGSEQESAPCGRGLLPSSRFSGPGSLSHPPPSGPLGLEVTFPRAVVGVVGAARNVCHPAQQRPSGQLTACPLRPANPGRMNEPARRRETWPHSRQIFRAHPARLLGVCVAGGGGGKRGRWW